MSRPLAATALMLVACGHSATPPNTAHVDERDPEGPHKAAVEQQVQPYLTEEVVGAIVIGLSDAGRREIYGFGTPRPDGHARFEIGSITKAYTGLLLADAVQRREVELDTPVAELLPPGVTAPTRDKVAITLRHLALHSSGLPRVPPSLRAASPDPYGKYDEDALYRDLLGTELEARPGTVIAYSNYGYGLLGFVLGKKIGTGYAKALETRVLKPLELTETSLELAGAPLPPKLVRGTTDDLQPAAPWTWQALAGAGALVSSARDQLRLVELELDAAGGGKGQLRAPMALTQESQLVAGQGQNEGLGWQIDGAGRYWHNGGTGGYRSFLAFDPKTKRGIVILAATATSVIDGLGKTLFDILDGTARPPAKRPTAEQLASYAGSYDLSGTKLAVTVAGKRVYLEGPGEPKHRLAPVGERQFWIEALQSLAVFQADANGKIAAVVFAVGANQLVAPRVP